MRKHVIAAAWPLILGAILSCAPWALAGKPGPSPTPTVEYNVTQLPAVYPGYSAGPYGLSDPLNGETEAAGSTDTPFTWLGSNQTTCPVDHAAIWTVLGTVVTGMDLDADTDVSDRKPSLAYDLNPRGDLVAGQAWAKFWNTSSNCAWYNKPVVWELQSGQWVRIDLPTALGRAEVANDNWMVAGTGWASETSDGHATVWRKDLNTGLWQAEVLAESSGNTRSFSYAINNEGLVVGYCSVSGGTSSPVVWSCDATSCAAPVDLPTGGFSAVRPQDVNEAGDITGYGQPPSGGNHALLWKRTGTASWAAPIDLGTLGTSTTSYGYAIGGTSAVPVVVGSSGSAFRWKNGVMADLNTLIARLIGWQLTSGFSINSSGQILAYGQKGRPNNQSYAYFLLTPVAP